MRTIKWGQPSFKSIAVRLYFCWDLLKYINLWC